MDDTSDNYSDGASLDDSSGLTDTLGQVSNWASFIGGVASSAQAIFQPQSQSYVSQPTAAPTMTSSVAPTTFAAVNPGGLMGWINANPVIAALLGLAGLGVVGGLFVWLVKK